ncbi:MAG: LPS export ABC transporter permease LptF [Pseudomonadota bacterium]
MRILDRYVFREMAATWLGVTVVLLLILLTNQFARVLGDVAKGKLPKYAVLDVIGLSAVQYLSILVPVGLFLSVMLALGRLYRDSELPAMMACRVGPTGIYRPLGLLLVPVTLAVAWVALEGGPRALTSIERIGAEAKREADLASIEAGRFTSLGSEDAVVYGERLTPDGALEKVFLQRRAENGVIEVVVAERGEQLETADSRILVLRDGRRYEGIPGTAQFRVVEFSEHGIPYPLPDLEPTEPEPRALPFLRLLEADTLETRAELQWRLSVPLSTVLLAFLAVPLAKSRPRAGRYGRIAIGLLVFIIYLNMLNAAKAWIEQGRVAPEIGLWWVHVGVLLFGLGLLGLQNNWHRRWLP